MANMTEFTGKKEFPSQTENRRAWILDTVRANQSSVWFILEALDRGDPTDALTEIEAMHKMDRDALLQPGGILTDEQIKLLTE